MQRNTPVNEAGNKPDMTDLGDSPHSFVRIIYNRGLQLLKSDKGWLIPSSSIIHRVSTPQEFQERFAARPLTGYRDLAPFLYPRVIFDRDGNVLGKSRYLEGYVEDSERRIYKYMVEHYLSTAATHLAYLGESYAGLAVLKNHEEWQIGDDVAVRSSPKLFNSALLHAESVCAALISALDTSRFLIWRLRGKTPDTLPRAIDAMIDHSTSAFEAALTPVADVWNYWADSIENYRDCFTNYNSVTDLGGRSGGELLFDDIWEICIDLPDNPEARTPRDFTFANDVDALEFCWEATECITRCMERALPTVFELAQEHELIRKDSWALF